MKLLSQLSKADIVSIAALGLAWTAGICLIADQPYIAIYLSLLAFIGDLLDGYIARKTSKSSSMGKYLDVHADVFIYLVFANLLYLSYITQFSVITIGVSILTLALGILRLIRFSSNGIEKTGKTEYYIGLPVYFPYFVSIYGYLCERLMSISLDTPITILLGSISLLMVSKVKNLKTRNLLVLGLIIVSIAVMNYFTSVIPRT